MGADGNEALGWLEAWVEENICSPGYVRSKASMRDPAEACAEAVVAAGLTIADLKEAAGGDLETYLIDRQNELTDASGGRGAASDKA